MNSVLYFNRRKVIGGVGLALPIISVSSCSNSTHNRPAQFIERELIPPISASSYRTPYKEPVGKFLIKKIEFAEKQRDIHIHVPRRDFSKQKSVLILLHGSNRRGPSMLDKWQSLADRNNILLVAPDSLSASHWSHQDDPASFFEYILSKITPEYGFDRAPIFGFGHSAGAVMMTLLSIHHGTMFERIAVHAGNISPERAEISKKIRKTKTPLAHFLGANDHIFDVENAKSSAQALAAYGQKMQLIILRGHNHWYYDLAPFINKQAWKFLSEGS